MMKQMLLGAAVVLSALSFVATAAGQDAPFRDAIAVWGMDDLQGGGEVPGKLVASGKVNVAVPLAGADRAASLARGGDGRVARLDGGYLKAVSDTPIRLEGKDATLCMRLRDLSGAWNCPLLAIADPKDPLANLVYANGSDLVYRWRTTPPWQRVEGISEPKPGDAPGQNEASYGFNGESNDAHDLLSYRPRQWYCSVVRMYDDGKIVLADQGRRAERRIDSERQHLSDEAFYVGAKVGMLEFLSGEIAQILVYDRPLSDEETDRVLQALSPEDGVVSSGKAILPREGLTLHLDAAEVDADENNGIARWKDLSGAGNDVAQPDGDRRPKRLEKAWQGLPAIRFTGEQFLKGPAVLAEGDDSFTIVAVWRRDHLNGSEVVCEQNTSEKQPGRRAALLAPGGHGPSGWMGNPNFANGVLPVSAPVDWFGRNGWHDVVVRFADTIIELYVDGVLIDEEWPHGALYRFGSPFLIGAGYSPDGKLQGGFHGEIDHVALWDRALSREEIVALSGGEEQVARRDLEILGPPQESLQYWKPRGKAYAGDCMVTCQDGVFHVFYLYDRLHHAAKWGLGAHQYGHFSSSDLKHWTHHPLAVPIDKQWECAMGTGNVIFNEKDGKWYAFYTDCGSRIQFFDKPQRGAWLFRSVSEDGVHFHKDFKPVLPGFDCDIFYVPETGLFHLIAKGGRTHYQSADLEEWTTVEDSEFRKTAERDGLGEVCPDTLAWNGWYYFTTSSSRIYKSRNPLGPWEEIPRDVFDGLFFSKMHEFKDGRALAAGWVTYPHWGGNLVVRELVQYPNGNLGLKFVPEMVPATDKPLTLAVADKKGDVVGDLGSVTIRGEDSLAYAALDDVPQDVRIRLTVRPSAGVEVFGLCLRGEGDYANGSELSFRPGEKLVQFGRPRDGGLGDKQPVRQTMTGDLGAMPPVEGLDRPFTIDLIVKERILDLCLDNRRTFIARRSDLGGSRLFFFAKGGEVVFEGIEICPLAGD